MLKARIILAVLVMAGLGFFIFQNKISGQKEPDPENTAALFAMMKARYAGKWFNSLSFTQKNILFKNGVKSGESIWYEYMKSPGLTRFQFGEKEKGNYQIFRNDSLYRFRADTLASAGPLIDDLFMMKSDVYSQEEGISMFKLKYLGIDTDMFHIGEWQGKKVYIIGAAAGDTTRSQYWIDAGKLFVTRKLEVKDGRTMDIQFVDPVKAGGGWTESKVLIYINGSPVQFENYTNIEADKNLPDSLFVPKEVLKPQI